MKDKTINELRIEQGLPPYPVQDKEKQIEEMANAILQGTDKYCELVLGSEDEPIHYEKFLAELLYNAGYRKEKETAKEILQWLWNETDCNLQYIKELSKKYGVEIEE